MCPMDIKGVGARAELLAQRCLAQVLSRSSLEGRVTGVDKLWERFGIRFICDFEKHIQCHIVIHLGPKYAFPQHVCPVLLTFIMFQGLSYNLVSPKPMNSPGSARLMVVTIEIC